MNIHAYNFETLAQKEWNYPAIDKDSRWTQLLIKASNADVSGGVIRKEEIDRIAEYPDAKSVSISGLRQDTFEYFIRTYGQQFRYINFFKNKGVEDWSLLETLPELEALYWFHNQKIAKMWDMSRNYALKAAALDDFTKLHDLSGVEKAPSLEWFGFGDAVWSTSEIDSLKPFRGTKIRRISKKKKKIRDMDISFIPDLKELEVFDFPTNLFTTEEVAWLAAKCPNLTGYSLKPYVEYKTFDERTKKTDVPAVIIVGRRKPSLVVEGNEERIAAYAAKFNRLAEKFREE